MAAPNQRLRVRHLSTATSQWLESILEHGQRFMESRRRRTTKDSAIRQPSRKGATAGKVVFWHCIENPLAPVE